MLNTRAYHLTEAERSNIHKILRTLTTAGNLDHLITAMSQSEADVIHELVEKFSEAVPGEPPWRSDLFTDEDRDQIIECVMDEVRDSIKETAFDLCDNLGLVECIGYVDPDQEDTVEILKLLDVHHISGDDLDSEHPDHIELNKFLKRMKLITDSGDELTPLGKEYVETWS